MLEATMHQCQWIVVVPRPAGLSTPRIQGLCCDYQYFIVLTACVCVSVRHGSDSTALPICGPISACILSATVMLPHFHVIASAFNEY